MIFLFSAISLILWGWVRTAILLIPIIFFHGSATALAGLWISFFAAAALCAPTFKDSIDFRELTKERASLILFCSAALFGALFYPLPVLWFGLGALAPLFFIRVFDLMRLPIARVYVFDPRRRWLLVGAWLLAFIGRWF